MEYKKHKRSFFLLKRLFTGTLYNHIFSTFLNCYVIRNVEVVRNTQHLQIVIILKALKLRTSP